VRLSLLVDAAELIPGAVSGYLKQHLPALRWRQENGSSMSSNDSSALAAVQRQKKRQKDASSSKQSKGSGAAAEARRVMSNYGLVRKRKRKVPGRISIKPEHTLRGFRFLQLLVHYFLYLIFLVTFFTYSSYFHCLL
jgi:hypothetical protein